MILALADRGKVQLDAPVGRYLPEWFADEPALRVTHLLTQTSGLADFLWLEGYRKLGDEATTPLASYVALGAAAPRRYAPGTRWSYSNTNYKALALIAERVAGRSFDSLLPELVLRPAGIDGIEPCHDLRPDQYVPGISAEGKPTPLDASRAAYAGDGGLCGSAEALAKWIRYGFARSEGSGPRLERLLRPTRLADGEIVPYGYARTATASRPANSSGTPWPGTAATWTVTAPTSPTFPRKISPSSSWSTGATCGSPS